MRLETSNKYHQLYELITGDELTLNQNNVQLDNFEKLVDNVIYHDVENFVCM